MKLSRRRVLWILFSVLPLVLFWMAMARRSWLPRTLWLQKTVAAIEFSPHGELLAATVKTADSNRYKIEFWDVYRRRLQWTIPTKLTYFAFSPDGHWLAGVPDMADSKIIIWDAQTGKKELTVTGSLAQVSDSENPLSFSPDSRTLQVKTGDNRVSRLDIASGAQSAPFVLPDDWDAVTMSPLKQPPRQGGYSQAELGSVASARGDRLVLMRRVNTDGSDAPAQLWLFDAAGSPQFHLKGAQAADNGGRFSNDGRWLLLPHIAPEVSGKRQLQVWDLEKQRLAHTLTIPGQDDLRWRHNMAVSTDGHVYVMYDAVYSTKTGPAQWQVGVWNALTGKLERTLRLTDLEHFMGANPFPLLSLSGDQSMLAVTAAHRAAPLRLWRVK